MKEVKYLNWAAITILAFVMILMSLLDYGMRSLVLFIPIIFNLLLIGIAHLFDNSKNKNSYSYLFTGALLLVFTFLACLPAIFGIMSIPKHISQFPEYYSKENRTERYNNRVLMRKQKRLEKSFEKLRQQFQNQKAPIENGIWIDGEGLVVPCKNGQIHGRVVVGLDDNKKISYFNHGEIDSIIIIEDREVVNKIFKDEDGNYYQIVEYEEALEEGVAQSNETYILVDTIAYSKEDLKRRFW